jgi:hypothetical protein
MRRTRGRSKNKNKYGAICFHRKHVETKTIIVNRGRVVRSVESLEHMGSRCGGTHPHHSMKSENTNKDKRSSIIV